MLTFFFSPWACSLASHIALEETGAAYEERSLAFAKDEQRSAEYLAINPRGRVPALKVGDVVLTENSAILPFIADHFPDAGLLPTDPVERARCASLIGFISSTVHPSYTHIRRPERFAEDKAVYPELISTGRKNFLANLRDLDALLAGRTWAMGDAYTVCDPYVFVMASWPQRIDLPIDDLTNLNAHRARMLARPAVQRVLEREGIKVV